MTTASLHALLENLIDYAGLFPPASLPMERALANYDAYRRGEHSWILGRFIVPLSKLSEVPREFPISVLAGANDLPMLDSSIDVIEAKASNGNDVAMIAGVAKGRTVYVEVPDSDLVKHVGRQGMRASSAPAASRTTRYRRPSGWRGSSGSAPPNASRSRPREACTIRCAARNL